MKARLIQKSVLNQDPAPWLEAAEADAIELICFGELATSGCLYTATEVPPLAETVGLVKGYPMRTMIGVPYRDSSGYRNAYVYVHGDTEYRYHKVNLFPPMNETEVYAAGSEPGIWDTDFGRVGVAICYDIRFPEYFAQLMDARPIVVVIPAAFPRIRVNDWRRLLVERAREMEVMVLGINAVGDDGTNEFGGSTMVVAADGSVLAQADETSETHVDIEIESRH